MSDKLMKAEGLSVSIEEGELLHEVSLEIGKGETHVLMGPNGAGKSTFGYTLMGSPQYTVTGGRILFEGEDITRLSADKRAKKGMFLSFQNPLEVPGLTLESFLRASVRAVTGKPVKLFAFRKELEETLALLKIDPAYAERELNVGFSGGEKKKAEILQLLLLRPKFAILDETDSGLDVDAVRVVSAGIEEYQRRQEGALLVITHSTRILESLKVDRTHVMVKGRIVYSGGASVVEGINRDGFEQFISSGEE
ncbi:MAG: Fe-S cluster assembly ATPase SufC [Lachnospiraceae bacterium]|nr:Fe-S cluster assembly ATPase SufC [Lachnospiraceae bacterium]